MQSPVLPKWQNRSSRKNQMKPRLTAIDKISCQFLVSLFGANKTGEKNICVALTTTLNFCQLKTLIKKQKQEHIMEHVTNPRNKKENAKTSGPVKSFFFFLHFYHFIAFSLFFFFTTIIIIPSPPSFSLKDKKKIYTK
ncbi:unnamed protein product [Ixodes pacificus]